MVIAGCAKTERRETAKTTQSVEVVAPATTRAVLRTSPGAYQGMPMRVVAVSETAIVVEPRFVFADGSRSPRQTLKIDPAKTQVFDQEILSERTDERGRIVRSVKPKAVEFERIKTLTDGAIIQIGQQGGVAIDIVIMPPPPATRPRRATTRTTRPARPARAATRPATRP